MTGGQTGQASKPALLLPETEAVLDATHTILLTVTEK
jgi:hypothetical protein